MADETTRPIPDFIIIGAAKSGTTALCQSLANMPGIFVTAPKEPEFFARDDIFARGRPWYEGLFDEAQAGDLRGEGSTIYSLAPVFPDTVRRVSEFNPECRLVYIMREPVSRAYAFYTQLVKNYQNDTGSLDVPQTFEQAIGIDPSPPSDKAVLASFDSHYPATPETILAGSRYLEQIEAYLAHFDISQLHFARFEDLVSRPQEIIPGVLAHIGHRPVDGTEGAVALPRVNVAADHFSQIDRRVFEARLQNSAPYLHRMYRKLPNPLRSAIKSNLSRFRPARDTISGMPPPMRKETRDTLRKEFYRDIDQLADLTKLDLSGWSEGRR